MTVPVPISRVIVFGLIAAVGFASGCQQPAPEDDTGSTDTETVEYLQTDATTRTSKVAIVDESTSLAHTTQLYPYDANGEVVGSGETSVQVRQVLDNIGAALAEVDAGLEDLVKIHVYAANTQVVDSVRQVVGEALAESAPPTIMYVETSFQNPDVAVSMDAVAVTSAEQDANDAVSVRSTSLAGGNQIGHATVLPPGDRVYIAGQAEQHETVVGATSLTMESLHETLDYLGLEPSDVVQVKGFMQPMSETEAVREEIASFYSNRLTPSIVLTEWNHGSFPIEIEMIAAADTAIVPDTTAISYITPPGMSESDVFSRVAQVHRGDPVYISGLYGDPSKDANGQIRDIFEEMDGLLDEAGSDFRHLAKATYYTTSGEASDGLGEIRPDYYDPNRPPAASLSPAPGIGLENGEITIDMIGVTARNEE